MSLIRWQPTREIENLRQQMNRLMDEWMIPDLGLPPMFGESGSPAIEIQETDTELVLKAQVPGMSAEDLEVEVDEEGVSITGEHKQESKTEEKGYFRSEFHYGRFERRVPLPMTVKPDQVKSEFKNGVLSLTLPKAEATKRKVVKVNVASS